MEVIGYGYIIIIFLSITCHTLYYYYIKLVHI